MSRYEKHLEEFIGNFTLLFSSIKKWVWNDSKNVNLAIIIEFSRGDLNVAVKFPDKIAEGWPRRQAVVHWNTLKVLAANTFINTPFLSLCAPIPFSLSQDFSAPFFTTIHDPHDLLFISSSPIQLFRYILTFSDVQLHFRLLKVAISPVLSCLQNLTLQLDISSPILWITLGVLFFACFYSIIIPYPLH